MTRILVAGDPHGDLKRFYEIFTVAIINSCDSIHVVGDFGYFPNLIECKDFLKGVSEYSLSVGIPVSFTDGNHENHEILNSFSKSGDIFVLPNIEWKYRGKYWNNFLSIGGAYSIDSYRRILGRDYFREETISYSDILKCDKTAEIVFSHDCPFPLIEDLVEETLKNISALNSICETVCPKLLIHGHYHLFHDTEFEFGYGKCRIIGLDSNEGILENQCVILDSGNVYRI